MKSHPLSNAAVFAETETMPTEHAVSSPVTAGAHVVGSGTDFALMAPHASSVTLCLFDGDDASGERRFALHSLGQGFWAGHIPGIGVGQRYGYRVAGRWAPELGLLHNPAKLLLDPYAKAVTRAPVLDGALFSPGFSLDRSRILDPDPLDSAPFMSLGVVTEPEESVTHHPRIPWRNTVIYECHVKGMTALRKDIPEELRGTYAGLAHPVVVDYLKRLGITAVELLPIQAKMDETFLADIGLTNYWGYSTLDFFAPEPSYATQAAQEAGPQAVIDEVKGMVAALHEAGIEVILDVVYNHTCEGGGDGPTISWRGIDNTSYYMAQPDNPGRLMDTTGCGNSLDFRRRSVLLLALNSLRYWADKIGVDGFRFDLAVTLGRNGEHFDTNHPFLMAMLTDPILGSLKLVNEPWDLGPFGWRTGQFPAPMADWNDHFRNTMRSFWVADPRVLAHGGSGGDLRDIATRLAGSADLFGHGRLPGGRGVYASINFITAHDGFTLHDLVSYDAKHNEANREDNRDGTTNNLSWNFGFEGATDAPGPVKAERRKAMRNLLGTLILSAGTPMITAGDEFGRTQKGNNNAYCQDNELTWVNWDLAPWQRDLWETTACLLRLRRESNACRPTGFYTETSYKGDVLTDLDWFDAEGNPMPQYLWFDRGYRTIQMLRSGRGKDNDVLVILNGSPHDKEIHLPEGRGTIFRLAWDSAWERPKANQPSYAPGARTSIGALSMQVYTAPPGPCETAAPAG